MTLLSIPEFRSAKTARSDSGALFKTTRLSVRMGLAMPGPATKNGLRSRKPAASLSRTTSRSGPTVRSTARSVGESRIKRGTKIDNLVQIGHSCTVGEDALDLRTDRTGGQFCHRRTSHSRGPGRHRRPSQGRRRCSSDGKIGDQPRRRAGQDDIRNSGI